MIKEYSSLMKNHTRDLIHVTKGQQEVLCKWVYITKYVTGSVDKHKAHLVAQGFS
jgi:hypothetical protein